MIEVKEDIGIYGGTMYADYLDPAMVRYLDNNYGMEDIDKFDAYIKYMLQSSGVRLSDIRYWNKKWIDNAMRQAKLGNYR